MDWAAAADLALHQAAYALACLCLTVALLLCFVVALFVLSLCLELLGQSLHAMWGKRGNGWQGGVFRGAPGPDKDGRPEDLCQHGI
jgi:hypothetical protein